MLLAQENVVKLPNGLDDLGLIKKMIDLIDSYIKSKQDTAFFDTIVAVSNLIIAMPCKAGAVKLNFPELPWEHFVTLAEIMSGKVHHPITQIFNGLIKSKSYQTNIKKELVEFQKKLVEISQTLSNDQKDPEFNELEILVNDIGEFDQDDSLEEEKEDYKTLRSVTNFYRDHLALNKIKQLLASSEFMPLDEKTGSMLAGLIIVIGEQVKKLSPKRRSDLQGIKGEPLKDFELNFLNRLWLYKGGRDAIRHAADFPENQLKDLKNILKDISGIQVLLTHMNKDLAVIENYINGQLSEEMKAIKSKENDKLGKYLISKLSEVKVEAPKEKDKKQKSSPAPNTEELPDEVKPIFSHEELTDDSFVLLKAKLKAKEAPKGKNAPVWNENAIDMVLRQLKEFLLTGKINVYIHTPKPDKALRGRKKSEINNTLGIYKIITELNNEYNQVDPQSQKAKDILKQKDFYQKVHDFIDYALLGAKIIKTPQAPVEAPEKEKKERFWGMTFTRFLQELYEYAQKNVVPQIFDQSKQALLAKEVSFEPSITTDLYYFLYMEFFGKGFCMDKKAICLLRELTKTNDERFNLLFEQLQQKQSFLGDRSLLEEVKQRFKIFFFGKENEQVFFEEANQANIFKNMAGSRFSNWKKLIEQFEHFFERPEEANYRNNGESRELVFVKPLSSLRPWEAEYEKIKNPLLDIRMLLSSKYKAKVVRKIFPQLEPEDFGVKFRMHFDEIKTLLGKTKLLLDQKINILHCKTFEEVLDALSLEANILVLDMAHISEHVASITYLARNYLLPIMKSPSKPLAEKKDWDIDQALLEKFTYYISIMRSCGNSLAHMNLEKDQQLGAIFTTADFKNIVHLLEETLVALENILLLIPNQLKEVKSTVGFELLKAFKAIATEKNIPLSNLVDKEFLQSYSGNVVKKAYPNSMKSFYSAMTTFGLFKNPPVEVKNEGDKEAEIAPRHEQAF